MFAGRRVAPQEARVSMQPAARKAAQECQLLERVGVLLCWCRQQDQQPFVSSHKQSWRVRAGVCQVNLQTQSQSAQCNRKRLASALSFDVSGYSVACLVFAAG